VVKNEYAQFVQEVNGYKGRMIYMKMYLQGRFKLMIIQLYIQPHDQDKIDKLDVYRYIDNLLKTSKKDQFKVIIMGDFNVDPIKLDTIRVRNDTRLHWKYNLLVSLKQKHFKNVIKVCHSSSSQSLPPTWIRNSLSSRIDLIFIDRDLLPDLIHGQTSKPHIFTTDHRIVNAYFITQGIFTRPNIANMKRHSNSRKVFDYDNTSQKQWESFAATGDTFVKNSPNLMMPKFTATIKTLNKNWCCIRDGLISAANDHLPNRMVTDTAKPFVPLNVLRWSKALRFLSSLLLALTHKKIHANNLLNLTSWSTFIITKVDAIVDICVDLSAFPDNFDVRYSSSENVFTVKHVIVKLC